MSDRIKKLIFSFSLSLGIAIICGLLSYLFARNLGGIAKIFTDKETIIYWANKYSKRIIILPVYVLIAGGFILFFINFFINKKVILIICNIVLGILILVLTILFTRYEEEYFIRVLHLILTNT